MLETRHRSVKTLKTTSTHGDAHTAPAEEDPAEQIRPFLHDPTHKCNTAASKLTGRCFWRPRQVHSKIHTRTK